MRPIAARATGTPSRRPGLPVEPDLDVNGHFTAAGGAEAMADLLSAESLPSAVFAMSDEMAIGAIHTIKSAGLPVPGHVSVIGFDDHDLAGYTGLTAIHQPAREIGETAAELLIESITGSSTTNGEPRATALATRLCVRSTTGPRRVAPSVERASA